MFRYALRALLPCVLAVALTALGPAARADLIDKAGLFQDDTAAKANELIGRMKADCGKDLVIETVEKPDWADPEWATKPPTKDFKSGASDPAHVVGTMNKTARGIYFQRWAREQARLHQVNGVYALVCKSPAWAAVVVNPEGDDYIFPEPRRAWLAEKLKPPGWLNHPLTREHYNADLLNEAIPGTWYTVQDNLNHPSESGVAWTWGPVLTIIGGLLGAWVVIALLRGVVGIVQSFRRKPELARTQVGGETVTHHGALQNTGARPREDSVDY